MAGTILLPFHLLLTLSQVLPDGERNEKDVANLKSLSWKPSELSCVSQRESVEDTANGEQNVLKENVNASKDAKPTPEKLPFAKVVANGC